MIPEGEHGSGPALKGRVGMHERWRWNEHEKIQFQ